MNNNSFRKLILILFLITGLFFLYMGYNEYFANIRKTKDYKTTDGYFMKYEMDTSESKVRYTLTYSYVVDRYTYFINASDKVTKLPPLGSQKKVKYNPSEPNKGIVVTLGGGIKYIIAGLIFLVVAVFGLINRLLNNYKNDDCNFYKIIGIISGILIVAIGTLIYYLYGLAIDSSAILDIWKEIEFMTFIPFILILVGLIIIISVVFFKKDNDID